MVTLNSIYSLPDFGQIASLFKTYSHYYFLVKLCDTLGFIEHLCAYEVKMRQHMCVFKHEDLYQKNLHDIYNRNGKLLIPPNYEVIPRHSQISLLFILSTICLRTETL
jgi:hypothetical protein